MEAACIPYMKMLGMWIYKGIISDPINEVKEHVIYTINVYIAYSKLIKERNNLLL